MTVLTKPSIIIKKAEGTSPLVVENSPNDEEKGVGAYVGPQWRARRGPGSVTMMTIMALMVAISGITCGLLLYRQYLRSSGVQRYRGFCSIPMENDDENNFEMIGQTQQLIEPEYSRHVVPLRWSDPPESAEVLTMGAPMGFDENFLNKALNEQFEVGTKVESIRVYDNGRTVTFIHDFSGNVTDIIDADRCFTMAMDHSLVLPPEALVVGMENGEEFEVSRVRSTLRALLPALVELAGRAQEAAQRCLDKPTYRLEKVGPGIRKRSVDAPPHDYIQFAGKHVQEIEIQNLGELLQREQAINTA